MMRTAKRTAAAAGAALAVVVGIAGLAWACSAQSYINALSRQILDRGSQVTVSGVVFLTPPQQSRVPVAVSDNMLQIRWNSLEGPRVDSSMSLATEGNGFTSVVTVPNAPPGIYYLLLVSGGKKLASTPVELTAPVPQAGSSTAGLIRSDIWSGFASGRLRPATLSSPSTHAAGFPTGVASGLVAFAITGTLSGLTFAATTRRRRQVVAAH